MLMIQNMIHAALVRVAHGWMDSPFTSQRSHFSSHRMGTVREWGEEWQMLMAVAPF